MNIKKILEHLDYTDLTDDLKIIADECGMETVKIILETFDGTAIYIPTVNNIESLLLKYLRFRENENPRKLRKEIGRSIEYTQDLLKKCKNC